MTSLLTGAMTALLAEVVRQALGASAARARARRAGRATIYRLALGGRLVIDAAILILGGLAAIVVYHGDDWRIAALLAGFALLCVLAYPGDIVVNPASGVRTRRWYGRAAHIRWEEAVELRDAPLVQQLTLVGANGRTIVHTSLHVDGPGFRAEVLRYAPQCVRPPALVMPA